MAACVNEVGEFKSKVLISPAKTQKENLFLVQLSKLALDAPDYMTMCEDAKIVDLQMEILKIVESETEKVISVLSVVGIRPTST